MYVYIYISIYIYLYIYMYIYGILNLKHFLSSTFRHLSFSRLIYTQVTFEIYIYLSGYNRITSLLDRHESKEPHYAFNIFNSIMTRCISHSRFKKCTNNFLQEQVRLLWSYSSVSTESQKPHLSL